MNLKPLRVTDHPLSRFIAAMLCFSFFAQLKINSLLQALFTESTSGIKISASCSRHLCVQKCGTDNSTHSHFKSSNFFSACQTLTHFVSTRFQVPSHFLQPLNFRIGGFDIVQEKSNCPSMDAPNPDARSCKALGSPIEKCLCHKVAEAPRHRSGDRSIGDQASARRVQQRLVLRRFLGIRDREPPHIEAPKQREV